MDTRFEEDEFDENEVRLQSIIRQAVDAAEKTIIDLSKGSPEELDYLTSAVAKEFSLKVHHASTFRMLKERLLKEKQ